MKLVAARGPDAHIAAAPHAEVPGFPNVRETAAHVDVWQNRGMSRGQSSEVRDIAVSLVVEVVALQALRQRWLCHGFGIGRGRHDTAVRNRTTEGGPSCPASLVVSIVRKDLCGFALHRDREVPAVHISNLECASVQEAC